MPNRLQFETSPYLLQHAQNPVDWRPWGAEALQAARDEDKPIFLSIGYAACHWCHVMAHESFEDPEIAAILNEHFISIKVDREERPDVDKIYMDAVVALTGQGGWPMSVFLTPEGKPFFGGTYFPPQPRYGMPSFREVLAHIDRQWAENRSNLDEIGERLAEHIRSAPALGHAQPLDAAAIDRAHEGLLAMYDWSNGGWGGAPKFPQAAVIDFLLQGSANGERPKAREMALHALNAIARGGIHDQLGGGFHRYAVDGQWLVPHFEKMLYDNATLLSAFLHAWQLTSDERYLAVIEDTFAFLKREMRHPSGGFFASLDADSDGAEGRYYIWTQQELREVLGEQAELASRIFGATPEGHLDGASVLHRPQEPAALAQSLQLSPEAIREEAASIREKLFAVRQSRNRPTTDDKILTAWNGLLLAALAQAAGATGRADILSTAQELAGFLTTRLMPGGVLKRSWRQGEARLDAYLEDHAALGLGCLALYQVDFNARWFQIALQQARLILDRFYEPESGFFDTPADSRGLIARPQSLQDSPYPSGGSMAAMLLLKLASLDEQPTFADTAGDVLARMQSTAADHPAAFAAWLAALDYALGPQLQLALIGERDSQRFVQLAREIHRRYIPKLVVAGGAPGEEGQPALMQDRTEIDGLPAAYLCRNFACKLPTTSPSELNTLIDEAL